MFSFFENDASSFPKFPNFVPILTFLTCFLFESAAVNFIWCLHIKALLIFTIQYKYISYALSSFTGKSIYPFFLHLFLNFISCALCFNQILMKKYIWLIKTGISLETSLDFKLNVVNHHHFSFDYTSESLDSKLFMVLYCFVSIKKELMMIMVMCCIAEAPRSVLILISSQDFTHTTSRIWIFTEPEFKFCRIKFCSSYDHNTEMLLLVLL